MQSKLDQQFPSSLSCSFGLESQIAVSDDFSVTLPISEGELTLNLPSEIEFDGREFQKKGELHLTLVNRRAAEGIRELSEQGVSEKVISNALQEICNRIDWKFEPNGEAFHLQKSNQETGSHKESIVLMGELTGHQEAYERIHSELGVKLGSPHPAHLTIYTS